MSGFRRFERTPRRSYASGRTTLDTQAPGEPSESSRSDTPVGDNHDYRLFMDAVDITGVGVGAVLALYAEPLAGIICPVAGSTGLCSRASSS